MYNLILMHVIQCSADLLHDVLSHIFCEFSFLSQEIIELPREAKLKD